MSGKKRKVVVLPCSGIGKTLGTVGREIAYELIEDLRPGVTTTTCLPLLMIEDPDAKKLVTDNPVITIDGCPFGCARKSAESIGVTVSKGYRAIDFCRVHKDLKPEGISELNEAGKKLVVLAAKEVAEEVDRLLAEEKS
ncbi:MAG: putative zinc-binding protein [Deltaproteobacteria bacterium]|nr:putative zinc-binding protein [Deltaproteobacteria bacterium]